MASSAGTFLLYVLVFSLRVFSTLGGHYNVLDFGAVGDGFTDDTQAFKDTWEATRSAVLRLEHATAIMYVPQGKTFLLRPIEFDGNQASGLIFLIEGELKAPSNLNLWKCPNGKCKHWIKFEKMDGLSILGSTNAILNGQGSVWWDFCADNHHDKRCKKKPTGLLISDCEKVLVEQLAFEDSPQMHIAFERSNYVRALNLNIRAPENSPNTDGIHLQHSKHVFIDQTRIQTGDDCVSIGDGTSHVNITNVLCGPGHGISIGSLGKHGDRETVEFVHVENVTFVGTSNGCRIKTWQGGKGHARHITFEHIRSEGSENPIIIDQFYCDHRHCKNQTSAVQISNVIFRDIKGVSNSETAVELACSESTPCVDILMEDVNLRYSSSEDQDGNINAASSHCVNVYGQIAGEVIPTVSLLS